MYLGFYFRDEFSKAFFSTTLCSSLCLFKYSSSQTPTTTLELSWACKSNFCVFYLSHLLDYLIHVSTTQFFSSFIMWLYFTLARLSSLSLTISNPIYSHCQAHCEYLLPQVLLHLLHVIHLGFLHIIDRLLILWYGWLIV